MSHKAVSISDCFSVIDYATTNTVLFKHRRRFVHWLAEASIN